MNPAEGIDDLLDLARLVDPNAILLHGHIHNVMPLNYNFQGHQTLIPGGFAEALRLNILDVDTHGEVTVTQIELRV
jgi:hypothetical protein